MQDAFSRGMHRFLDAQNEALARMRTALDRDPQPSARHDLLFARYVSALFDTFGFSTSSPGIYPLGGQDGAGGLNALVAAAYGATSARVNVSGSSGNLLALIGGLLPMLPGGRNTILCDANAHKSALGGLILSRMNGVLLETGTCPGPDIPAPVSADAVRRALSEAGNDVAAVIVTSPTYEGFDCDLPELSRICAAHGVLFIVDAAWGSQYGLAPCFAPSAIRHCDVAVLSLHKSGMAPCQVSAVLFRNRAHADLFDQICSLGFATTSPNQLLLMATEHRFAQLLEVPGQAGWQEAVSRAADLRRRISDSAMGIRVVSPGELGARTGHPLHILLDVTPAGADARELSRVLSSHWQIDAELAHPSSLLLLAGRNQNTENEKIITALEGALRAGLEKPGRLKGRAPNVRLPRPGACNMGRSWFGPREPVALSDASGRISAGLVTAYPPGRAIVLPGQRISQEHAAEIRRCREAGILLTGLADREGLAIDVEPRSGLPRPPASVKNLPGIRILTIDPRSTDEALVRSYADLFRETFSHSPFCQFAFDPADPFAPMPPEMFMEGAPYPAPLEILDRIVLPGATHRYMDPDVCLEVIRRRCAGEGYLTLAFDTATNELAGLVHGRAAPLQTLFETEEWADPLLFSARRDPQTLADADEFFLKCWRHFGLAAQDQVFTVSAMLVRPGYRGRSDVFFAMMRAFAGAMRPQHVRLPMLAEVADTGTARIIDIVLSDRLIHGLLKNGHDVVYAESLDRIAGILRSDASVLRRLLREEIRLSRLPCRPHPEDHPGLEVRSVEGVGRGVFAVRQIAKGETLAVFAGETYWSDTATGLPACMVDHAIQTGPETFVHARGRLAELLNHSCAPNAGVRNYVELFAARDIAPGEEVCWDYRCSENSDWILRDCRCGAPDCDRTIAGYSSLPGHRKQRYLADGMISEWLAGPERAGSVDT